MIRSLIILFVVILILACAGSNEEKTYEHLRRAVLEHYKGDRNPLKIKAARFLLDNLKDRFAIEGERVQSYSDSIRKYYHNGDSLHKKIFPLRSISFEEQVVMDIDNIKPEYLIDNIDRSFAALDKSGWKDQVSFNDFCEYILPYRVGNEPLENWRKDIVHDSIFKVTGDEFYSSTDVKTAATLFVRKFHQIKAGFRAKYGEDAANIPDLPYSTFKLLSTGTCVDLSKLSIFSCRAAGIHITSDFTPRWSNYRSDHEWPVIISESGLYPYNFPFKGSFGSYKADTIRKPSKVYRNTFSENPESHVRQRGYCEFLPWYFNNSRLIDVTDKYIGTNDIKIAILFNSGKNKFAYLGVNNRESWDLVGWGVTKSGSAKFSKVGFNSVYLPVFVSEEGIKAFNYPFMVLKNGQIRYLKPDIDNVRKVELLRKSPLSWGIQKNIEKMIRSKFQASNDKDFKNAVTFYTITKYPDVYYNEIMVNSSKKFRYVRYLGRDSTRCYIAELEFYARDGSKPLKGAIIGTKGGKPLENAFDGDILTFIEATLEPNRWVGLDLGKPEEISKIRYVARNDKNHIVEGNSYELFYWEDEWKSLGKKTASDKVLIYDNAPSNCLFLLKNYTEGKEEQIFTYENGKQVWW